jgi:1-acyl-sn-glycerol-3-phosphate acyltransferase
MALSPTRIRPSLTYLVIGAITYPILRIVYRLRSSGGEHLPRSGGFVLAANHNSNFDPWPLAIPLFPRRYLRFMAKAELFWPPLGWVIAGAGGFKVRRGERDTAAIETAAELARRGHVVVMFPEGTRRAKGLRKKYEARWRTGAARIALEAGVPLVPAAISGTDMLARLARLTVVYGAPIDISDLAEEAPAEAARIATDRLRVAIESLEASLR